MRPHLAAPYGFWAPPRLPGHSSHHRIFTADPNQTYDPLSRPLSRLKRPAPFTQRAPSAPVPTRCRRAFACVVCPAWAPPSPASSYSSFGKALPAESTLPCPHGPPPCEHIWVCWFSSMVTHPAAPLTPGAQPGPWLKDTPRSDVQPSCCSTSVLVSAPRSQSGVPSNRPPQSPPSRIIHQEGLIPATEAASSPGRACSHRE